MSGLVERFELRVPPVAVAVLLLLAMRVAARWGPGLPGPADAADALGTALTIGGVLFAAAGAWQFHRHATTVDPMHPDRATSLVDRGVVSRETRRLVALGRLRRRVLAWSGGDQGAEAAAQAAPLGSGAVHRTGAPLVAISRAASR